MSTVSLDRCSDVQPPAPLWLVILFWIGYLAVLFGGCWLAGIDVAIAHAWHWLGAVLATTTGFRIAMFCTFVLGLVTGQILLSKES